MRNLDELNRHRTRVSRDAGTFGVAGVAGPRRRGDPVDARGAAVVAAFASRADGDRLSGCRGVRRHGDAGCNQVLQSGPVSPASRKALDAELALHDNFDGYRWALRSERASVLLAAMHDLPGYDFWLMRGMANDATLRVLAFFDQQLSDTARPFAEVIAEKKAATQTQRTFRKHVPGRVATTGTRGEGCPRRGRTGTGNSRSLRVLNALQARATRAMRLPKLAELGLPEEVVRDPFNGQPLKFKRLPDGWKVYSVGRNLTDDGGKLDDTSDVGFGPIRPANVRKEP